MYGRRPMPVSTGIGVAVVAALPWSWFLLRDVTGGVGDVLAIVLPLLVLGLAGIGVIAALLLRQRRWLAPVASVLVMGTVAVLGPWLPAETGAVAPATATTVGGANVLQSPVAVSAVLQSAPDVLVVSEMTIKLDPALAAAYPYRHLELDDGPTLGVYSRFPFRVLERPTAELPGIRVEVAGRAGPFVLYALHVPRPWISAGDRFQTTVGGHHRIMESITARVAAETLPVVVVGDLNTTDRGRDYRRLLAGGGLVDAARDGGASYTSTGKWTPLLLRIDHVMITKAWCADASGQLDLPRSDHRAVTAAVGPCVVGSAT